ncbi:hypothetical protein RJT34_14838 [Clitoria ternatea]|uniref:Uncharacterized protein n=1 Tax=Clitoria ternatea TaxID=43366 RepID=A0AAN9PN05_CLITE
MSLLRHLHLGGNIPPQYGNLGFELDESESYCNRVGEKVYIMSVLFLIVEHHSYLIHFTKQNSRGNVISLLLVSHCEEIRNKLLMYPNQAFSSGSSYAEMMSGNPLLPHNYTESVGGQNEVKFITAMGSMHSINEHSNAANGDPACNSSAGDSHVVPRTQMGMVDSEQNIQCQGLSLSLGTLMPSSASVPPFHYQYPDTEASANHVPACDLHFGQSMGYFDIPVDHVYGQV